MVVSSKHSDPRFGEQTYTLKNIVRAEPDPSLFTVPREFKFMTEPGTATYKVRTPKPSVNSFGKSRHGPGSSETP